MKITLYILLLIPSLLSAQKKTLDYNDLDRWPSVNNQDFSPSGNYLYFTINEDNKPSRLIIQQTKGKWTKEISNAENASILYDDFLVYNKQPDTLVYGKLPSGKMEQLTKIYSFKASTNNKENKIAYVLSDSPKQLNLINFSSHHKITYDSVENYQFSPKGKILLLTVAAKGLNSLLWIDLTTMKCDTIFKDTVMIGLTAFDELEKQLLFITFNANMADKKIKYYNTDLRYAKTLVDNNTSGMEPSFSLYTDPTAAGIPKFSVDGKKIFFNLESNENLSSRVSVQPDIWNSQDDYLLSASKAIDKAVGKPALLAVTQPIENNRVVRLQNETDDPMSVIIPNKENTDYILLADRRLDIYQVFWKEKVRPSIYLVSTNDGKRTLVREKLLGRDVALSPNGKFITWYDFSTHSFFSYEIASKVTRNITEKLPYIKESLIDINPEGKSFLEIAGWLTDDAGILIYDKYDLWKVDPLNINKPENITGRYGEQNNTILRLPLFKDAPASFNKNETVILMGFNEKNKNMSFYKKTWSNNSSPVKLSEGPYIYQYNFYPFPVRYIYFPPIIKAKDKDIYVLQRMSSTEYPNLFLTNDFITFQQASDLQPQKTFNWLTTELVRWQSFDGNKSEGILFKPENFDPNKKYPVIFTFYEKNANGLNSFLQPALTSGNINVPFFVSNGYVIFDPNIYFNEQGKAAEMVYNYIASAAKHLAKFPWIDTTRMGIYGHSFGGYEVNYMITRTNIFKAAVSAAGISDLVSFYGSLCHYGDGQFPTERGQQRIGATLWEKPELYIENSPIFRLNKVSTPLLIQHNQGDLTVPWQQSVELFNGLRRLKKPVWMLQYDNGTHQLETNEDKLDYTKKLVSFFNHFLKDSLFPNWMQGEQNNNSISGSK